MPIIEIPFSKAMAEAALDGYKIATTRRERKGEIGDEFGLFGARFRIIDIKRTVLADVARNFYRIEGFDSMEAFVETWRSLHRGHFKADQDCYIHFFGRIA